MNIINIIIHRNRVIINNSIFVNDSSTACNNFFWNGNNYLNSGLYTDTLSTSLGCDSIVSLHLTILENFIFFHLITNYKTIISYAIQNIC